MEDAQRQHVMKTSYLDHASMSKILGKKKRAQKNSRIYSECNNMSQSINQIGKRLSIRFRV
ncbi:hypothetical protein VAEU17_4360088 [Vibrio aestuarianus]|nr:hypothetical protein VAEU17_4360088 [Vibrio aestuarianus]